MVSPTPSAEGLFFSSPGPHDDNGCRLSPGEEVLLITAKAQLTKILPAPVAAFLSASPEQRTLFNQVFSRQIELLKSRSQAFEDGHVTVYDKTLLTLTRNGNDLQNPAAVAYFCEEYLGIDKLGDPGMSQRMLQQSVTLPALLNDVYSPSVEVEQSIEQLPPVRIQAVSAAQSHEMEAKLARLWSVYEKARIDFLAVSGKSDALKTAEAAKFLRDTAENTIQYLENKNTDPVMMAELHGTYEMAKSTAVSLTGGKKRKFDCAEMDKVKGTPRGPSKIPSKSNRRESHASNVSDRYKQASSGGYNAKGYAGDRKPSAPAGRGHSGMPYGYSRAVDSYQPH